MSTPTTTSDAILRCAHSSIVAGGYSGFSYADIAAVVGIRKASIHHHFPTKSDLVRTLVKQYREQAEAGLAAMERDASDALEQLRAFTGFWEACIGAPETSYCLCALLATQIPVLPDEIVLELRAYFRTLSAWLESALERGVQEGIITLSGSPHAEAEALMATVHGAMSSARAYGEPEVFAAITRPAIDRLRSASPNR
ncbi:TetR/AcrR family transcriptional regulator [Mycolicibacterium rhodesiae]|uniref:TetR family transcriptional regulator n=1 Tax=Mycolicibacterium rhodesiae TaxID=36814 RepID=A0A1X0J153_MYCRH|nr:TetR/AcrR family transcriptional regulator [Mycolicibacterium rhodesiae]MCV7344944.1 TetR/AcrR family transcriptional regulator [Mycolicibacterium rhodesiae]ORB55620.1 TetR family transcriptional regulator [Mycolicibacterium rhodesiae]